MADRTWAWERVLMPALRSGTFAESAVEAETAAGVPLTVFMASIYMQTSRSWDDDADVRSMDWPVDLVRFECSGGTLTVTDAKLSAGLLPEVSRATTFRDIASGLDAMPSADWAWVDFTIGIRLSRATEPKTPDWSAAEIWRRACQPWAGWIG